MKLDHFKLSIVAFFIAISLFNAPTASGDETEMINEHSHSMYMAESCEERNSHVEEHIAAKTAVHHTLTENHERLRARIEELLASALGKVNSELTDGLQNSSLKLEEFFNDVNTAFDALIAYWTVDACTMTEEEFAQRVSHETAIAQYFEATSRTITVYRESVVLLLVDEVTTALLTAVPEHAEPVYVEPERMQPELTTP